MCEGPALPFHWIVTGTREFMRGPRRLLRIRISLGRSSPKGILIASLSLKGTAAADDPPAFRERFLRPKTSYAEQNNGSMVRTDREYEQTGTCDFRKWLKSR